MLSFNQKQQQYERAIAVRAAELFISTPGLSWADAYPLAAYELTAPPARFQSVVQSIQRGNSFQHAIGKLESADGVGDPISKRASDYAWGQR